MHSATYHMSICHVGTVWHDFRECSIYNKIHVCTQFAMSRNTIIWNSKHATNPSNMMVIWWLWMANGHTGGQGSWRSCAHVWQDAVKLVLLWVFPCCWLERYGSLISVWSVECRCMVMINVSFEVWEVTFLSLLHITEMCSHFVDLIGVALSWSDKNIGESVLLMHIVK